MENKKQLIEKFQKLPIDQQLLFEQLLEDCINHQVRLLDGYERTEFQFNEYDHDLPW
jgi:hypothetical protein